MFGSEPKSKSKCREERERLRKEREDLELQMQAVERAKREARVSSLSHHCFYN